MAAVILRLTLALLVIAGALTAASLALGGALPGGMIAFASSGRGCRGIYLVDPGRGLTHPLLCAPTLIGDLAWSRDGDRLAFVGLDRRPAADAGDTEIYVYDLTARALRQITNDTHSDADVTWSPDGEWLYYWSIEGSTPRLMRIAAHLNDASPAAVSASSGYSPTFGPDAARLAFVRSEGTSGALYLMDAASGRIVRELTRAFAVPVVAAWSPLGDQIAFVFYDQRDTIYLIDADGGEPRRLPMPTLERILAGLAWSPDAGALVFGAGRLYLLTLADGDSRPLTQNPIGNDWDPAWRA